MADSPQTTTQASTTFVGGFNAATQSQPSSFTQAPNADTFVSPAQATQNAAANPLPSAITPSTSTISSNSLTPTTATPFQAPNPTPIPSVSGLDTTGPASGAYAETPMEEQESELSTRLAGLNDSLVGKSADQTAENNAAGVPQLTQQQQDLSSQVTSLKNEAAAIPQQLQLDATGRGITSNGLAPIQTAALRNNSIQALSVSALLDATNGLLASAQTKANAAVAAKYDPIQEQITAATNNLNLIKNNPETTAEDKQRAQAQLDIQTQKAAALTTAKQNATDVLNASIAAAKNGADAGTLQKMQAAPDGATALQIATAAGYGNSNISDLMTKYPDAGIQPGDTLATAQQKVVSSPSYTTAQKSAILDNEVKEATIAKDDAGTGTGSTATGQALGTTGSSTVDATQPGYSTNIVSGSGGLTQAAIDQAALSYATTGQLPSGARSTTGPGFLQSEAIKNRSAELNANGNIQGNKAELTANTQALKTQTDYLNTTQRAFNTANDTLSSLTSWMSANDINPSQFPDFNSFANYLNSKGINPGAAGGYNAQIATLRAEYSQVLAKGGTRSVQTDQEAASLIPDGLSPSQLETVAQRIQVDGTNAVNDAQKQVSSIQDKINGIIGGGGSTYKGVTLPGSTSSSGSTYNGITLPN